MTKLQKTTVLFSSKRDFFSEIKRNITIQKEQFFTLRYTVEWAYYGLKSASIVYDLYDRNSKAMCTVTTDESLQKISRNIGYAK